MEPAAGRAGRMCAEPPHQLPASFSAQCVPEWKGQQTRVSLVWRMLLRLVAAAQWRAGPGPGPRAWDRAPASPRSQHASLSQTLTGVANPNGTPVEAPGSAGPEWTLRDRLGGPPRWDREWSGDHQVSWLRPPRAWKGRTRGPEGLGVAATGMD